MSDDPDAFDVLVMGAGVTGLTAAAAAAASGLRTAIAGTGLFGGLVLNVNELVEPPRPDLASGADYAATLYEEAMMAGVECLDGEVAALAAQDGGFVATLADDPERRISARAVICATGAVPRPLPVAEFEAFLHRGVAHCADCDGPLLRGKPAVVVGGGDAALQTALSLVRYTTPVHLVLRGAAPRARAAFRTQLAEEPRILLHAGSEVTVLHGADGLEAVQLRSGAQSMTVPAAAIFPCIGLAPTTAALPEEVARDAAGALIVDDALCTSIPGLFAAGAVRAGHGGRLGDALADAERAARSVAALLQ